METKFIFKKISTQNKAKLNSILIFTFILGTGVACQTKPIVEAPPPLSAEDIKTQLADENQKFKDELEKNLLMTIRNEIIPELREFSTYSSNLLEKNQKTLKGKVFKKTVVGRVEWIQILNPDAKFRARVDTGAQTCSLHAENITEKEVDGKPYVEFTTEDDLGKRHTFLREVIKKTLVKSTSGVSERRYVIRLDFMFGGEKISANVNLNDRKTLRHNFLIGRNLLLGNYIVDVSQSRLLGE